MNLRLDSIEDIDLKNDIIALLEEHKKAGPVIDKLINYYTNKLDSAGDDNKKRKLAPHQESDPQQPSTKIPDLSFQLPARKKYTLVLTRSKLQLLNEKTQTMEYQMDVSDLAQVTCVPSPEKPTGCYTFALFSKHETTEPFVFTVADKGSLTIIGADTTQELTTPEEKKNALVDQFRPLSTDLSLPSRDFYTCSGVTPSTGKADPDRTFVKTYLRTKEGVLYFLPQGILFGFKKPTVFIPKTSIAATVITNVTNRTFELGLQLYKDRLPLGAGTTVWTSFFQEPNTLLLPFSMIEQSDYAGIEGYIQKLGINDQSMTEATKAPEPSSKRDQYEADVETTDENATLDMDEEEDEDFRPDDNSDEENPLEYDSDASVDDEQQQDHDVDDLDDEQQQDHDVDDLDDDEVDLLDDDED